MEFATASDAVTRAFQHLGNEWALLSVGDEKRFNTMTISWGSLGFIWQRPVVTVLVRPQRYTHELIDTFDRFSVSFYEKQYHKSLGLLGTLSGREENKIMLSGLTPEFREGVPTFKEAYLTVTARTLYRGQLEGAKFQDAAIPAEFYPNGDFHTIYMGEIIG